MEAFAQLTRPDYWNRYMTVIAKLTHRNEIIWR